MFPASQKHASVADGSTRQPPELDLLNVADIPTKNTLALADQRGVSGGTPSVTWALCSQLTGRWWGHFWVKMAQTKHNQGSTTPIEWSGRVSGH